MTRTHDGQEKYPDDTSGCARETPTVGRRRLLLGGTAGAMALISSGVALPNGFLADIEAREGANGGALGGRHGKNGQGRHRRRHRNRKHHQRQNTNGRGDGLNVIKGIEFRVEVTGTRSVTVKSYIHTADDFTQWLKYWETKTIAPGSTAPLQIPNAAGLPLACRGAIWIDGRYYVDGRNPIFGTVALLTDHGGTLRDGQLWSGGTTVFDHTIEEGQSAPAMVVDGVSTTVTRLNDEEHFKVFKVSLSLF